MHASFVHLRLHTEYSLIDGIVKVKPLMSRLKSLEMKSVAVTDMINCFAAIKVYKAALANGVKPIFGCDVWVKDDNGNRSSLTLLCLNNTGYHQLTCLISDAYLTGERYEGLPLIPKEKLLDAKLTDQLICLSGTLQGEIGQAILAGDDAIAKTYVDQWNQTFPERFYIELQRLGREGEHQYIQRAIELASKAQVPVVATHSVCFLEPEDFDAHEVRVAIHDGYTLGDPRRPKRYTQDQYLASPEHMLALFADIPEAIENTVEIAKRCNVTFDLGKPSLPRFPTPKGMDENEFLRQQSHNGLTARMPTIQAYYERRDQAFEDLEKSYRDRLNLELDVIINMGFPGYFLIVADFIQWSKSNGIPVGPGRGSGAGSLVAYALKITDLDPLPYDLLFERFLNPERISMPDFDVDFCMDGRDRVIDYVAQKYGRDAVSQIITYGSMAAKAVVRDVGRVLGHGYGFVDSIAKLIPLDLGMTLSKALEDEPQLKARYINDDEVKPLIDMALKLEGTVRNVGKHAGGVVIAPSKLTDFTPVYCEEGSQQLVSQYDKDDVEAIGLVKFDFLGLRNLTIINNAVKIINAQGAEQVDIEQIPLDDPATFKVLQEANTTAVFQLESRGMKELIKRLQPDCFEDIVALVALFRPGPLQSGMVDDFIDCKHGRQEVVYPHPDTESILKPTYGIILYQEQVMKLAQVLAGYTLGGADMLRRAMGKKKPEEMAKQRKIFMEGALKKGIEEKTATYIFDLMEKFAGYGFNKSHSAAYALVAYQTAWLKAHYPAAFMAAVLSSDMNNTDKIVGFIEDTYAQGLAILPPDVNASEIEFTVLRSQDTATSSSDLIKESNSLRSDKRFLTKSDDNITVQPSEAILFGLGAIKGAGESALEYILAERAQNGAYTDLFDFCRRMDTRKVNKRVIEALIDGGAFDKISPNRATLYAALGHAMQSAEQQNQNASQGQDDLFGEVLKSGGHYDTGDVYAATRVQPMSLMKRLLKEKEALGVFLTGHPVTEFKTDFARLHVIPIQKLQPTKRGKTQKLAGIVSNTRRLKTKRGDIMNIVQIDDGQARIEMTVFPEQADEYKSILQIDQVLVIDAEVSDDKFTGGLRAVAKTIHTIDEARIKAVKKVCLTLHAHKANDQFWQQFADTIKKHQGSCPLDLYYQNEMAQVRMRLSDDWQITPTAECVSILNELCGHNAQIVY